MLLQHLLLIILQLQRLILSSPSLKLLLHRRVPAPRSLQLLDRVAVAAMLARSKAHHLRNQHLNLLLLKLEFVAVLHGQRVIQVATLHTPANPISNRLQRVNIALPLPLTQLNNPILQPLNLLHE